MDEKFASLERRLIEELAYVKWLLHDVLEQQSDRWKNMPSADLYDTAAYSSPRQSEINKFNNTLQNLATLNGQYTIIRD